MLANIAQRIATMTSEVIDHDVLITDNEGKVLGSSDDTRIGTWHQASLEIVKTKKEKIHHELSTKTMIGVKPGITLPIMLHDELIGTIGITGDPNEVKQYGILAKKYAELFLREELLHKNIFLKEKALQSLVQDIVTYDLNAQTDDQLLLVSRGNELGYNLKLPRVAIIIDLFQFNDYTQDISYDDTMYGSVEIFIQSQKLKIEKVIKKVFQPPEDLCVSLESDKFIVLHTIYGSWYEGSIISIVKDKCNFLLDSLKKLDIQASIGIGNMSENIKTLTLSYRDARSAIKIGKKMHMSPGVYYIEDYYIEDLLLHIQADYSSKFIDSTLQKLLSQPDVEELFLTISVWCESNLNVSIASKKLNIHRNTLLYRLKKMEDIMEVDFKQFNTILKIYIAIKLANLKKKHF